MKPTDEQLLAFKRLALDPTRDTIDAAMREAWAYVESQQPQAINPRPTRESCEARIVDITAVEHGGRATVLIATMDNGHILTAESHAATKDVFSREQGGQVAMENLVEKVYQLESYLWRERQWHRDGCPSFVPQSEPPQEIDLGASNDDGAKILLPGDRPIIKTH